MIEICLASDMRSSWWSFNVYKRISFTTISLIGRSNVVQNSHDREPDKGLPKVSILIKYCFIML